MRALLVLLIALPALPLFAADFEAGVRHVVAMPMGESGDLDIPLSRGFAATGEVFFTPRISAQLSATFVNPEAILYPSTPPPEDVDLGTLGLDVYSATARLHFRSEHRFSPFVGAGGALVMLGNLDDQFGGDVEAEFDDELTFVVEGGVRYRFRPSLFLELSAAYLPLEAETQVIRTNIALPETVGIDPLIVSAGASWRF
ncbi:MAG TPA: OmpW family outer membrane protein [Thermoanaerobaculia bacterium]|nr:OmpW family outer membrane protein [Thermoanaerobaculia bacterium]